MQKVVVHETFRSIQGESTYAGLSCFFIRLAGCNLDCSYCDTPLSRAGGRPVGIKELADAAGTSTTALTEITGGEPLLQPGFPALAVAVRDRTGRPVLVETNGTCDISLVPDGVTAIMDVKTPGSGECDRTDTANFERLRPGDEVKFVLTDRADYEWARGIALGHALQEKCRAVLFGPADGMLDAGALAEWIVEDGLPVRLNIQLHKLVGAR